MFLYIIFIEPFLILLKTKIQPTILANSKHQINAFVDDVSIFIHNCNDLRKLESSVEAFEQATNSKVNRKKSSFLKLGFWKIPPSTWIAEKESIKMLGIEWHRDLESTTKKNCDILLAKIKQTLHNTFNRLMTLHQKVIFFNNFICPKFYHLAKILPIPDLYTDKIQQFGHTFIWKHKLETLAKNELYQHFNEGGLSLLKVKTKYKSLFLKTIIKEITEEPIKDNGKMLKYWVGLRLRNIFPIKIGPNSETTPDFLRDTIKTISILSETITLTQSTKTKEIYDVLISKEHKQPKIIIKNPGTNFKPAFKALNRKFLSPQQKEHLFLQIHNALPTKDRLIKCKKKISAKCDQCEGDEVLIHLYQCKRTQPAVKLIQRRISNIYDKQFYPSIKQLFLLDFPNTPKKTQNYAIFLAANLSLIVWKKRKKCNFMSIFISYLENAEKRIKQSIDYKYWF